MRVKLLGLLVVVMMLVGAMAAPPVSAETTDEAYYMGQVNVLMYLTMETQVEFTDHMQDAENTTEWKTTMITMVRSWAMFEEAIQDMNPPRSYEATQENLEKSYEHLVNSGELFEQWVTEEDGDLYDEAYAELNESAKYLTMAAEEMQKVQD